VRLKNKKHLTQNQVYNKYTEKRKRKATDYAKRKEKKKERKRKKREEISQQIRSGAKYIRDILAS